MNKLRRLLVAAVLLFTVLVATLSGLSSQGMGSLANAAAGRHTSTVSALFVGGKLARLSIPRPLPPCPVPGVNDC